MLFSYWQRSINQCNFKVFFPTTQKDFLEGEKCVCVKVSLDACVSSSSTKITTPFKSPRWPFFAPGLGKQGDDILPKTDKRMWRRRLCKYEQALKSFAWIVKVNLIKTGEKGDSDNRKDNTTSINDQLGSGQSSRMDFRGSSKKLFSTSFGSGGLPRDVHCATTPRNNLLEAAYQVTSLFTMTVIF